MVARALHIAAVCTFLKVFNEEETWTTIVLFTGTLQLYIFSVFSTYGSRFINAA
jgi:hypothetical protein